MSQKNSKMENLIKNDKGMSIVTVVVAIGFVAILVSIIMISSVINFRMKSINVYTKDSFYSAEQVLDEINIGLQRMVSDGLGYAYSSVMENYALDDMSSTQKNEHVKAEFYEYIWKELGVDKKDGKYIVMSSTDSTKGLYGLLKPATQWNSTNSSGAFLRGGEAEIADAEGNMIYPGKMFSTKDNGVILKDLTVYYKDPSGFISAIRTDIRLVYPNFTFSNNNIPDIVDYTLITDTLLSESHGNVARGNAYKMGIKGNSFAYAVDTTGVIIEHQKNDKKGDIHIVATDMNIVNGGITNSEGSVLWAENIELKSGKAELGGYTYVKDDLNITGKNSNVVFKGYYTGYGNSANASDTSSAILVNGVDTTVDLSNVKKLTLAGRAFVATSGAEEEESATDKEFMTGQSIAVKSDQLMYMVPSECIGTTGEKHTASYSNPMSGETYDQLKNDTNGELVDYNYQPSRLGGARLGDYIDDIEVRVVRSAKDDKRIVTLYMAFKDEELANQYFAKYYNTNGNQYMNKYLKLITFPTDSAGDVNYLKVDMAGAAVKGPNKGDGDSQDYDLVSYRTGVIGEKISESYEETYITLSDQFDAYCSLLSPDLYALEETAGVLIRSGDNKAVFKNLVDEEVLKDIGSTTFEADGLKIQFIYNANVDHMAKAAPGCNLIIANCGVDMSAYTEFKGTVLAKGEIKVPACDFNFIADPDKVEQCMLVTSDDEVYKVSDVFVDADEVEVKAVVDEKYDDASLDKLVKFENWTKNVEIK